MRKLISLDIDSSIPFDFQSEVYLNPDFVYLPLPKKKMEMKKEKNLKKGSMVYQGMYSPISGKLINLEKCFSCEGEEVPCLVVANDFQEKSVHFLVARKKINNLTQSELLESLYDEKLKNKLSISNISLFVISGIDDDPYMREESLLQKMETKKILETIDALLHIFPGSSAIIAIKNTDNESIVAYNSFLGMFPSIEIRLVENLFLLGKEEFLLSRLHVKEKCIYLKASEVYSLYHQLKKRRPLFEKMITITGDVIATPRVVRTKLGVKVESLLEKYFSLDFNLYDVYANGIMLGKVIDVHRSIVTKELDGIIVMKKQKVKVEPCSKCGKCIAVCPIRSNPLMAYKMKVSVRCIECGLCSYICPSNIPLQNYLSGDKHE